MDQLKKEIYHGVIYFRTNKNNEKKLRYPVFNYFFLTYN